MGRKLYLEVLNELHHYVNENELQPGDKLPSERVLSDQLNVGRSSVREALRSLEVLGIIETRRGEGTFLCDISGHQLVELLSTFILTSNKSKTDINELKILLEKSALQLLKSKVDEIDTCKLIESASEIVKTQKNSLDAHTLLFREIFLSANNQLLMKIWILVSEYARMSEHNFISTNILEYIKFINSLKCESNEILAAYEKLIKTV
ncbi:MAG: GntR family transcriptional regulator [Bacillales bacterium]|nr:GntR family transcriptional regulator [Bacillales bacterium]